MSTALAKIDDHQDKLMGQQLTTEFKEAVNGMWRVVRVGAMMIALRQRLMSNLDIRPESVPLKEFAESGIHGKLARGKNSDGGIKAWLEKYAPDVERGTAYRFEDVTKAVAKSFELPARVAKRLSFEQIVVADPKDLDEPTRKVREKINGFVAGTSQKSWLDQFREAKPRGGDTSGSRNGRHDPEAERNAFLEGAKKDFCEVFESLDRLVEKQLWKAPSISDALLEHSVELAADFVKQARAWLKTPRRERTKIDINSEPEGRAK